MIRGHAVAVHTCPSIPAFPATLRPVPALRVVNDSEIVRQALFGEPDTPFDFAVHLETTREILARHGIPAAVLARWITDLGCEAP
jgi:hypothetical protein